MDYYVYVYIDPRNFEEFYYGKGKDSRKDAHLSAKGDSAKTRRIEAILKSGSQPIVRVIAKGLTEAEALLIEKTLLYKLGKSLTNIATGHFANKFRPHDTLHIDLPGFDFKSGIYYYNVGQGEHRQWEDYRKFNFISAGQGRQWARAILGFNVGDIFTAYLKGKGYVGIGQIAEKARPIRDVRINGRPLIDLPLKCKKMNNNIHSDQKCEYVALVKWIKSVPASEAKSSKSYFMTANVRASLNNQPRTRAYLEKAFNVNFGELAR
ncbi:MAG: GIY-YIG nuclease family protein [Xanthobacteraceae bacterium]|nr:GIY-YIG nuclease family protein [Xanthobacteraceae bacterium]MBX3548266.1 GIY-YIG nuclease family protein [Xanthobacteraceae bacterium]